MRTIHRATVTSQRKQYLHEFGNKELVIKIVILQTWRNESRLNRYATYYNYLINAKTIPNQVHLLQAQPPHYR